MKIIVVDDERLVLDELCEIVAEARPNADIERFMRADKAIEYCESVSVDIAFLDINLVATDGVTLAKKLQSINPRINIIFTTGYLDYTKDALDIYCSAYILKPATSEQVISAFENLRYPVSDEKDISIRCFGNFEIYYRGEPIQFKYSKTKELCAYLVDRNGADCTTREIMSVIFEDEDKTSYYDKLRQDLINTFKSLNCLSALRQNWGKLGIDREAVSCDYYDYLDGNEELFRGEYMSQYSFAEYTLGRLGKS